MAYKFEENRVVINAYHGVTVFATYKGNFEENGENEFTFTTNPLGCEDDDDAFDIREWEDYDPNEPVAMNLTRAIDEDFIAPDEHNDDLMAREGGADDVRDVEPGHEDNCPVCGKSLTATDSWTGDTEDCDGNISYGFACKNCGAEGVQWNKLVPDSFVVD